MDHIIVNIHPFIMEQEIQVYREGKCINISKSTMQDLEEDIAIKAKLYNITNIDLAGDKNFSRRIKERLTQNKFDLDLDIKIY